MDHITRCPHCRTAFRVSAEQLRAAAGQVRCGRCGEIFDAQTHLIAPEIPTLPLTARVAADAEEDAATARGAVEPTTTPAMPPEPVWPVLFGEPLEKLWGSAADTEPEHAPDAERAPARSAPTTDVAPAALGAQRTEPAFAPAAGAPTASETTAAKDIRSSPELVLEGWDTPAHAASAVPAAATRPPDDDLRADFTPAAPVATVVTAAPLLAERSPSLDPPDRGHGRYSAEPRHMAPAARRGWWLLALLLALALLAQGAFWQRSQIAARWPAALPLLQQACAPLGCTVAPYQRLDALRIDDSRLRTIAAGSGRYTLGVVLRNHSALTVATPSLDLTLTDDERHVLVRRVLSPADLDAPATLAAGASADIQRTLQITSDLPAPIAHYTLTALYP